MQEERRRRELERSSAVHGEDDRHSREIRDLAGDRRADVMSQQRHQVGLVFHSNSECSYSVVVTVL